MSIEASQNSVPEQRPYPRLPLRVVEFFIGSARKDALHIIGKSTIDQWTIADKPAPELSIQTENGKVVFPIRSFEDSRIPSFYLKLAPAAPCGKFRGWATTP